MIPRALYCLFLCACLHLATPSFSSDIPEGSLLIDDEAQSIVQEWIDSLAKAANLKGLKIRPYFVASSQVNAGATLGNRIIIFSGLLLKCQNVEQFIAVLAHEMGHIQGGHIARLDAASQDAFKPSMVAIVLGAAAALATGSGAPLMAGISGGSEIYARKMMHHTRTHETSSDQAAVRFCKTLGWEGAIQGLYDFLKILSHDNFMSRLEDPYLMTHPPEEERLAALKDQLPQSPKPLPAGMQEKFQRIRAKFAAYLLPAAEVQRMYPGEGITDRYARVIVAHRQGRSQEGLQQLEELLKKHPQDPYFWELKGQIFMELGQPQPAIQACRQALTCKKQSAVIKLQLGQLLSDHGNAEELREAAKMLRPLADQPDDVLPIWRVLARIYGKTGEMGRASWALAEEAYHMGDKSAAATHAMRAQKLGLKDPRLEDILMQERDNESPRQRAYGG